MGVQQAIRALHGASLGWPTRYLPGCLSGLPLIAARARHTGSSDSWRPWHALSALVVSRKLGLFTLNWLLNLVVPLGPVAIVILFYPELRHALEEFGPRFWQKGLSLLSREDLTEVISAVTLAVASLSTKRVGASLLFFVWFRADCDYSYRYRNRCGGDPRTLGLDFLYRHRPARCSRSYSPRPLGGGGMYSAAYR